MLPGRAVLHSAGGGCGCRCRQPARHPTADGGRQGGSGHPSNPRASLLAGMLAACAHILVAVLLRAAEGRKQKGKTAEDTGDKGFSLAHVMFVVLCVGFVLGVAAAATAMRWFQRNRTKSPKQEEAKEDRQENPLAAEREEGFRRRGAQPREQPGLPREPRHRGFEARHVGVCAECKERYEKGTAIVHGPSGWVHLPCETASLERAERRAAPTRRSVLVQSPCSFTKNFTRMTPLGDREQGAWPEAS